MIDEINKFQNENTIVFMPAIQSNYFDSINDTIGNVVKVFENKFAFDIIVSINNSKIKKIYLLGNSSIYGQMLPKLNRNIDVCWIYDKAFSSLSELEVRNELNQIFDYYDRNLINSVGCISLDNKKVFENAGYKCEYIDLKIKKNAKKVKISNTIGILSNDYDPNNNFYNQLSALTFLNYELCKIKSTVKATSSFCKYFNIKIQVCKNIDEVMANNFANLYVNFTNTNKELIQKSFNCGVPVIVGNTDFYDKNKYLKEHLVVKSDDDVNEIADKINYVKDNYIRIMEEYNKL